MTKPSDVLMTIIGNDFIEIAILLAELRKSDPNQFWNVAQNLGVGKRKAYYLAQVGRSFSGLMVSKDRLRRIGWTTPADQPIYHAAEPEEAPCTGRGAPCPRAEGDLKEAGAARRHALRAVLPL
jgi:hypothetical protein